MRRVGWLALLLVAWLLVPGAAAAGLTVTVSPDSVALGESATLTLTFDGDGPDTDPTLPNVPNLQFQGGSQQRSTSIINGRMSSSTAFTYLVMPRQVGDYTIPAITAVVDGKRVTSQPVRLRVTKSAEQNNPNQPRLAFVRIVVPKTQVYVGEVFPVEVRLYVISGQNPQMQPLTAEGFTFGKATVLPAGGSTQIQGTTYNVAGLKCTATATKEGKLSLGPAECSVTLRIPQARRQRRADPFEDLFGDPFGNRVELRPVRLQSEAVEMTVLPLPQKGQPEDFSGAVGQFAFASAASPTNVAVGDPVTLKVQVTGRGNLEAARLPSFERWSAFKAYPPTAKLETTDDLGWEGTRTFEQVLVPQGTEVREIPAFTLSYFDPEAGAYRTFRQPATPLVVRPAGSGTGLMLAVTNAPAAERPAPSPEAVLQLKARPGAWLAIQSPWVTRPWFLAAQALPLLLWLGVLGGEKWRARRASDPRFVRRQQAARALRQGLAGLKRAADSGDSAGFYDTVFRLLQEQLGERLDLPAAAITEAEVEARLRQTSAPTDLVEEIRALFELCDHARYAPAAAGQNLQELRPRVEAALTRVRQLEVS